ncbi:malignant fibrous histiocytoma-amplified sequence 1 homolog [Rhinophrynus dorsalis]
MGTLRKGGEKMDGGNKVMLPQRHVDLSLRRLKVIPLEVLKNDKIQILNLDRNKLCNVPELSCFRDLKILILSKNELTDFPMEIQLLSHLEKLEMNQNKIQSIPSGIFPHLRGLRHLKLNNNLLSELPVDLCSCSKLQYLNLSHNLFRVLPQTILELKGLREFYIENNKLQVLPSELFLDLSLKKFKASHNYLRQPPDEVCSGGLKQIRSYFRQLKKSQAQEDRQVKVLFIGASMAGKTTICRSLTGGYAVPVSKMERTVGIEISKFQTEEFTFLFWDFAGHLEYYLTHHVFITPHALVILVVDLHRYELGNSEVFHDLVGFWIGNLLMRVPESVVLTVGTHVDLCQPDEVEVKCQDIKERICRMLEQHRADLSHFMRNLEERQDSELYLEHVEKLRELYNCTVHVQQVMPISCTNYQDIKNLQQFILSSIRNVDLFPNVVKMLPPLYKVVEHCILEVLESQDTPLHGIMELDHLLSKVLIRTGDCDLDKDLFRDILRYLHRIGLIVWYEDIKPLVNTVFLKPAFLITIFKILVRHDLSFQLQKIPLEVLVSERAFKRDILKWQEMLQTKAMLRHKAIRVLMRHQLDVLFPNDAEDLFLDMVGSGNEGGKLFSLLEHFQICFTVRNINKLDPAATEFVPGSRWSRKNPQGEGCYLFPTYLRMVLEVTERWGGDNHEDLHMRVYFSPQIPEGFFQRIMVKSCSFYNTHWVEKSTFLLVNNGKPLLVKENNQKADSYLEIRSRRPHKPSDFKPVWDFALTILSIVQKLCMEWPGLYMYIRTPCRTAGCPDEFEWPDMEGTNSVYDMIKEDFVTCKTCCNTVSTELILPRVLDGNHPPFLQADLAAQHKSARPPLPIGYATLSGPCKRHTRKGPKWVSTADFHHRFLGLSRTSSMAQLLHLDDLKRSTTNREGGWEKEKVIQLIFAARLNLGGTIWFRDQQLYPSSAAAGEYLASRHCNQALLSSIAPQQLNQCPGYMGSYTPVLTASYQTKNLHFTPTIHITTYGEASIVSQLSNME